MKKKIKKLLIANRGEIAVRIIKTCKEAGIKTVAIFSDADEDALHVKVADEVCYVGAAQSGASYLNQSKIIEVIKATRADAVHPGYGFLSENSKFVELLEKNRILFVGPSSKSIRKMGDKTEARKLAQRLGIPIIPGTTEPLTSLTEAHEIGEKISYPILLKAAGGGGGKGMRIVRSDSELSSAFNSSRSEAKSAFGDDRIYVEKYIENPKHIEVQIVADSFGNVVHLGERECSVQRRHQKIVEESPSTYIDERIRKKLTKAAIKLTKESGYRNAGTLEFIFDGEKKFYFLEMNTRLQVEHPVTEMRISRDIVREQIKIAENEPLSFSQEDITFNGHAVECRIYAEDPADNFFPSTGKIVFMKNPGGFGIREDRGVEEGNEISPYYDPLISKLITWGNTRSDAISRMSYALEIYEIFGVRNNLRLCEWIMKHPDFVSGKYTTNFLNSNLNDKTFKTIPREIVNAGSVVSIISEGDRSGEIMTGSRISEGSRWISKRIDNMR